MKPPLSMGRQVALSASHFPIWQAPFSNKPPSANLRMRECGGATPQPPPQAHTAFNQRREVEEAKAAVPPPHAAPRPMEASESSLPGPQRQSTRVSMPPPSMRLRRSVSVLAISAHQDEAAG